MCVEEAEVRALQQRHDECNHRGPGGLCTLCVEEAEAVSSQAVPAEEAEAVSKGKGMGKSKGKGMGKSTATG